MSNNAATNDRVQFLQDRYTTALREYVEAKAAETAEAALHQAYKLGRGAVTGGVALLDLALAHRRALMEVLKGVRPGPAEALARQKAWEFFLEALGPYEMTQRGFREVYETLMSEIAQRRSIQQELDVHQQHLEEMVDRRTAELKLANESLRKEMALRVRGQEELRLVNRALRTISECNRVLVSAATESELLDKVCRIIVDVGGYPLVCVSFAEQDPEKTVRLAAHAVPEGAAFEPMKVTWADDMWGRGPTGTAIRTGKPYLVQDFLSDPGCAHWRPQALRLRIVSALGLPLLLEDGQVFGAVSINAAEPNAFQEAEMKVLLELADDLTYGIQALRMREHHAQAEEALRESEMLNRSLVEHLPQRIFIKDQDLVYRSCNARYARDLGIAPEQIVGKDDFAFYPSDLAEHYRADDQAVMASGAIKDIEERYLVAGEERWVHTVKVPYHDEQGRTVGVVGIFEDITERKRAEMELKESGEKLHRMMEGTIRAITSALEMRDPYTAGHERRVADLACAIAGEMGLPADQIEGIRIAGYVHDIGKISVPAEILSKPGKLTELEFAMIKTHPLRGHEILKEVEFASPVALATLQHHERLDGSGYPQGLSGDQIILEARILAVADVVEAMSSHRPYRPALGMDVALEEIVQKREIHYDPRVVDACVKLFKENRFRFE